MTNIKPEANYEFIPLTSKEIVEAYASNSTVTARVEDILAGEEVVKVKLGNGIMATLPFSEVSIYPLRYSQRRPNDLSTNVRCLYMKKIRVKITSVDGDNITVSRKLNMLEAYEKLLNAKRVSMYITEAIEKSAFGDIGEGITGKILINDVCRTHLHHVRERLSHGQTIEVIIKDVDDEQRFAVSYRETFKEFQKEDYPVGMKVRARIGDWIKVASVSTYYAEITPQVPGILTIDEHRHMKYGTKVECVVTGANEKGLYLKLAN